MATGTPTDKVYPIDVARALQKIKEIKEHTVFWNSGSESEQILRTGEAVMGLIWHTRAHVLSRETSDRITWTWNQGLLQPGILVVPKGNPAGELVQHWLASMTSNIEGQLTLLEILGNGPTNPGAADRVPAHLKRTNPADPANVAQQFRVGGDWWAKSYADANTRYLDLISS